MDLVPPQRISASTFYYFDGRLVLVLEVLQDGQAKVKVVGGTDELYVPVRCLKPSYNETDLDNILDSKLLVEKAEAELENFKIQSNEAAKRRKFQIRMLNLGNTELKAKVSRLYLEVEKCEESLNSLIKGRI